MSELMRLSVNLNQETAAQLKEMADRGGRTFTETIRRVISIAKYIEDERMKGNVIHIVDKDRNEVRELIFT